MLQSTLIAAVPLVLDLHDSSCKMTWEVARAPVASRPLANRQMLQQRCSLEESDSEAEDASLTQRPIVYLGQRRHRWSIRCPDGPDEFVLSLTSISGRAPFREQPS